ncbi:MAG: GNAT family N-acetyltransferase [Patescibacteria group bacterium]
MSDIRIVRGVEFHGLAQQILSEAFKSKASFTVAVAAIAVLTGDRISCCDEGIVFAEDPTRGIATLSPMGEDHDGTATVVGVFVRPADRLRGYGKILLEAGVRRLIERGHNKIRLDLVSKGGKFIAESLPYELRGYLDVHDFSNFQQGDM